MDKYVYTYIKAAEIAEKYREHLSGKDFLTSSQMGDDYPNTLDQPFIITVEAVPANDKIIEAYAKDYITFSKDWQKVIADNEQWNKEEYIVGVFATNDSRGIYFNELNQFLHLFPDLRL